MLAANDKIAKLNEFSTWERGTVVDLDNTAYIPNFFLILDCLPFSIFTEKYSPTWAIFGYKDEERHPSSSSLTQRGKHKIPSNNALVCTKITLYILTPNHQQNTNFPTCENTIFSFGFWTLEAKIRVHSFQRNWICPSVLGVGGTRHLILIRRIWPPPQLFLWVLTFLHLPSFLPTTSICWFPLTSDDDDVFLLRLLTG